MSRTLRNIKIGVDESLEEHLSWLIPDHGAYRILRQSLDARGRKTPQFVYSVEVFDPGEPAERPPIELKRVTKANNLPIVIVGSGPAGMFAALRLIEQGLRVTLFEQGGPTEVRVPAIAKFWRNGALDPLNNVGFGEGGAGLFSDGKLITRIKSPHIPYVMQRLVKFGAPAEIEFRSNPHVGSDRIRRLIPKFRQYLINNGCEIRFNTQVTELLTRDRQITGVRLFSGESLEAQHVILATGHSATPMFHHLHELGVQMEGKSFAVGLRIEHPQEEINRIQHRELANHPKLGAANYRLAAHDDKTNVGVYSFCMCPGGYVLSSGTEPDGLVSNGMSNYRRGSKFANAAIVISIDHKSFGEDLFGGLEYRRALEVAALNSVLKNGGCKELPAQRLMDFLERKAGPIGDSSSPSGVVAARLDQLFDESFLKAFDRGIHQFESQMRGFISPQALLHGVESRTSCPIRVLRDPDSFESLSHKGLYPTGEGAGYAGGITSAACDGVRVADRIVKHFQSQSVTKS